MKTYILPINVEPDEKGLWYAEVPLLPGCALSCCPLEHVLESIQDAAQMMLEGMIEYGDTLLEGLESCEIAAGCEPPPSRETVTVSV